MNCEYVNNRIIDFIDKNLSEKSIKLIEDHIMVCDKCAEVYQQTSKILNEFESEENKIPEKSLSDNFYKMLNEEKSKIEKSKNLENFKLKSFQLFKYAALIVLFVSIGFLAGRNSALDNSANTEIAELKSEMVNLQSNLIKVSLESPSSSQKLKIINNVSSFAPDSSVIKSLVKTLDIDENVNVRLAAANALANFNNSKKVQQSLAKSLLKQKDPLVQITLINILVNSQNAEAKKVFEKIIEDKNSMPVVRQQAKNGLKIMI